jgi:hypothetical protein
MFWVNPVNSGYDASTVEAVCSRLAAGVRTANASDGRSWCGHPIVTTCWDSASAMPLLGLLEVANVFPALRAANLQWSSAVLDGFLEPGQPAANGIKGAAWDHHHPACDVHGVPPTSFVAANRTDPRDELAVAAFAVQIHARPTRLPGGAVARGGRG